MELTEEQRREVLSKIQESTDSARAKAGSYYAERRGFITSADYDAIARECASGLLQAAAGHLEDRAVTYDQPGGERSMARTVTMFNELTGASVSTEQGWLFMALLKMVRSQAGEVKRDNYEDLAAYAALAGEEALRQRENK